MTLDDLIHLFISSSRADWNVASCWGVGSGPSYRDKLEFHQVYNTQPNVLTHSAHGMTASFKPDLMITIAWGLDDESTSEKKFKEDWTSRFPDKSGARFRYLDFFYSSALVLRVKYASVDGGRYELPIPDRSASGGWQTERRYADVLRKLNEIGGNNLFDQQMTTARIEVIDSDWPV
jgi:hypothetical protein